VDSIANLHPDTVPLAFFYAQYKSVDSNAFINYWLNEATYSLQITDTEGPVTYDTFNVFVMD